MLFIQSAESVEHIIRNHLRAREFALHFANSRAEVAAADTRGYRDHPFEVVAHDFGLATQRYESGHSFQWKEMAVWRTQKQILDVTHGIASVARNPNADAD